MRALWARNQSVHQGEVHYVSRVHCTDTRTSIHHVDSFTSKSNSKLPSLSARLKMLATCLSLRWTKPRAKRAARRSSSQTTPLPSISARLYNCRGQLSQFLPNTNESENSFGRQTCLSAILPKLDSALSQKAEMTVNRANTEDGSERYIKKVGYSKIQKVEAGKGSTCLQSAAQ